ncbi:MAG: carboxypeptidase regulatory-like domain-containing protein [Acidobacteriota bacterium]
MNSKKIIVWAALAVAAAGIITLLFLRNGQWRPRVIAVQGAVIRQDKDPNRRLPISGATVSATDGVMKVSAVSDASGYYHFQMREKAWPGQTLLVSFAREGYKPLSLTIPVDVKGTTKKLYVARMEPVAVAETTPAGKKLSPVTNIRIRYTVNAQGEQNIASAVKTFQVVNRGNIPCNHQGPCSPDGLWKAATGAVTLDAGHGNEFRNVRASCIAGPCPFTRIDSSGFEHGGEIITASALDWSDTATFLVEAEVFRTSINSSVRESYPVLFGRTLNFVLPGSAEGVSIEADLDGTPMVFPLGPELYLSWATCTARGSRDNTNSRVYRCELRPDYRF